MVLTCLWLTNQGMSLRRHIIELFPAFPNSWRAHVLEARSSRGLNLRITNHTPVAFQKNIVHRDLKLGNMVLNKR